MADKMNLKIFTDLIEEEAVNQIHTLMKQPAFAECKVRIMPDVHAGKGCVIGFTADLGNKVIPNIVGVDIGCGMYVVDLGDRDIDLQKLDSVIKNYVPCGKNVHEGRIARFPKLQALNCYRELKDTKRIERSIGTLGGGNHFIEIDVDEYKNKYLVIHTGSRNLGKQVAEYYQSLAVELMQGKDELYKKQQEIIDTYKAEGRKSEIQSAIKELHRNYKPGTLNTPKELCYLEGEYRDKYLHDMLICQEYASLNRMYIANIILEKMGIRFTGYSFETIHNYIDVDSNIVRKGAISARKNELLLIPINMRDGCILGVGKGNEEWNFSAPHGAGRLMSRTKAKENLTVSEFKETMSGIYSTTVGVETLDEAPMAYKPMESIVDNIKDTVEIKKILKPIYNFKAGE
jgi:RNA-splicing ligase RtcB